MKNEKQIREGHFMLIQILWAFNHASLFFLAELNKAEDKTLFEMYEKTMLNYAKTYDSLREIAAYLDDQKKEQVRTGLIEKLGGRSDG